MAMEIKEALMVSLVPAYLVKGPVVEHWVKHRIAGGTWSFFGFLSHKTAFTA